MLPDKVIVMEGAVVVPYHSKIKQLQYGIKTLVGFTRTYYCVFGLSVYRSGQEYRGVRRPE